MKSVLALWILISCAAFLQPTVAVASPGEDRLRASEADYYRIETVPVPDGIALEASGLALLPDGRLAVATRRGEIWILQNPSMEGGEAPHFSLFAHGLHEPVGLAYKDGSLYATQRGELTRIRDRTGDGRADLYETIYSWPQSGNHHAYSYGPRVLPDGRFWVTFGLDSPAGGMRRDTSLVPWRGWTAAISEDGAFEPIATGLKQPAGFGLNSEGDLFVAEHDDLWVAAGFLSHVEKGDFLGHPAGLRWKDHPDSPVEMDLSHMEIPSTEDPMYELARDVPAWKLPAVWLPVGLVGAGAQNDVLTDTTGGRFGPFEGQLYVGDYSTRSMARVFLEKVDGVYQGAAFPFREGFMAGIVRQEWGSDGSMFVGMTTRGWPVGEGDRRYGLQRLVWTGEVPFEIRVVRTMPDGFELEWTRPVHPAALEIPSLYRVRSFNYKYHDRYGSPTIREKEHPIQAIRSSEDGRRVRLAVEDLRLHYIYEIRVSDLLDREGVPLLHDRAYFTLNRLPEGEKLSPGELVRPLPAPTPDPTPVDERRPVQPALRAATKVSDASSDGPEVTIEVRMLSGLRFHPANFEIPAGKRVALALRNDDDMIHNIVFVMPGRADEVGDAALSLGAEAYERDWVPDSTHVLYHSGILQPGELQSLFFTAPEDPGDYPFVCTIPGHHLIMRGVMRVAPRR